MRKSIYAELTVLILIAAVIATGISGCIYAVCHHNNWMVEKNEDYSNSRKNCDIYVMELMHNINNIVVSYEESVIEDLGYSADAGIKVYDDVNYKNAMQNWYHVVFEDDKQEIQGQLTVTDKSGRVLWETQNDSEEKLADQIQEQLNQRVDKEEKDDSDDHKEEVQEGKITKYSIDKLVQVSSKQSGDEYLFVFNVTVGNKFYYLISQQQIVPEVIYSYTRLFIVCVAVGMIVFLVIILFGIRKKIRYIKSMSDAVKQIAKGDFNTDIKINGNDELAVVASSISNMQMELNDKIKNQMENEEKVREMITNISHDLKTPLTVITGYVDVIKNHQYENEQQCTEYLDKVFDRAIYMDGMIKKIFQLARQGNLQQNLNITSVNLVLLLKQMFMEYQLIAQKADRTITFECESQEIQVDIDVEQIMNAFGNLYMNAIKYSILHSEIQVQVKDEKETVSILFKNKADNLKASEIDRFFDKFYRGDKARNSKVKGNGVGLSLVKEIVEQHQGNVWTEYKQGIFVIGIKLRKKLDKEKQSDEKDIKRI